MTYREQYAPGPASGAQVQKDGEKWTLILVRELRHAPEKVWQALTSRRICASGLPLKPLGAWVRLEPRWSSPRWERPCRTLPKQR